jgi:hypothetical protein
MITMDGLIYFLVNGWRLEGFPAGAEPTNRLFRNNRDGTFTDITEKAGLVRHGWGQGVCVGDYDNDGFEDLFVTYWGHNVLYYNNGDGTFTDVSEKAGVTRAGGYYGLGVLVADFDNDGWPDIFYCNGHVYPELEAAHVDIKYREPRVIYRNLGNGRFADVSAQAGSCVTQPSTSRGCAFGDFDNDGDIENYGFNELAHEWHSDHGDKHDAKARETFLLMAFLASNLFHAFRLLNLKPEIRRGRTQRFWARLLACQVCPDSCFAEGSSP